MAKSVKELYSRNELLDLKTRLDDAVRQGPSIQNAHQILEAIDAGLTDLLRQIQRDEHEWRDAFDAIKDPVFFHDEKYLIIRANQAYANCAGMRIQEIIGKPYWQVFPKSDAPLTHCHRCFEETNKVLLDEITTSEGSIYLSRGFAVRDEQGNYRYSVHILEDVSEQRRLQKEAEESMLRYRSLFESAPDAVFLADAQTGQLLDANPAAERLTGRSRAELITLHQSALHPADSIAKSDFIEHVDMGRTGRLHKPTEIPILHASGRIIPVEITTCVFQLTGRQVIQGVFRDVSNRIRAEGDLKEANSKLSQSLHLLEGIVESVPIRVFWKDRDLRYLGCNVLFAEDAGLSGPDDLKGKTDFDLSWKEQAEFYREDDRRVMDSGVAKLGYEEPQTTPDGNAIWLRTSKVPLHNDAGEVTGVVGIYDDITRQKQAEQDLLRSQTSLAEAQRIAHVGNWELDIVRQQIFWSEEMYSIFEIEAGGEAISHDTFLSGVHPEDRERVKNAYSKSVETKVPYDIVHRLLMPDGRIKYVRDMCVTHYGKDGQALRSLGTIQDITGQYLTEQALNRSNCALKAISRCNSVLVHANNETELLNKMCDVIIEEGGYRFAWIGYVEDDEDKYVRPVAYAGYENGYLDQLKITYADSEYGRGPAGRAVRCRELQVVHDTAKDVSFTPWRELAMERGYRSVLALPLINADENVFGVLVIYAGEPNAFDADALKLMQELANDLAFGILALRTRSERDHYLQAHQKSDERLKQVLVDTIHAVSLTVEKRDPYTAGHQYRVAQLSVAIGQELEMDADRLEGLRLGAMIHDIGKIYVPAEILNRPGRLSKAEFEMIKSHSEVGFDIIKDVQFPWPVAQMVLQHHERIDGSGYPKGLRGDEIILEAQILAVADVVEAITAHRPYRPAVGLDKALLEIETNRGTRYDPDVVDACLHLIRDKGFSFEETDKA
jgi:PAS domain S-box-containing protein/putative nucleotidyltransferase with HDIG domain